MERGSNNLCRSSRELEMRVGSLGKGVTVTLLLCLLVSSAHAVCMDPQPRLVCAEYFHEQTVVIARLFRSHYVEPKGDAIDYHIYSMRAENILHGRIDPEFRIYEENSSGRANFD